MYRYKENAALFVSAAFVLQPLIFFQYAISSAMLQPMAETISMMSHNGDLALPPVVAVLFWDDFLMVSLPGS